MSNVKKKNYFHFLTLTYSFQIFLLLTSSSLSWAMADDDHAPAKDDLVLAKDDDLMPVEDDLTEEAGAPRVSRQTFGLDTRNFQRFLMGQRAIGEWKKWKCSEGNCNSKALRAVFVLCCLNTL